MSIGGKLKFKGNFQKKLDDEKEKIKAEILSHKTSLQNLEDLPITSVEKRTETIEFPPVAGTGRIVTSGNTVHGKDTKFNTQLAPEDFIIVLNQNTLVKEERQVNAILSDKSAILKQPFPADIISYSTFEVRKKPETREVEGQAEEEFNVGLSKLSKKIKKPTSTLEYREKTGMWGYKVVKETFKKDLTREELLDMRAKKSRDKFCWVQIHFCSFF